MEYAVFAFFGGVGGFMLGVVFASWIFRKQERKAINTLKAKREELSATVKNNQP